jgi:hypothetical protein
MDNGLVTIISLVGLSISLLVINFIYSIHHNIKQSKNYLYVIMRLLGDKKDDVITREELKNLFSLGSKY